MPKVLLADDSATMQKVVDLVLKDHGYQVRSASNGADAMAQAREFKPDVVLAYIKLPGMSGYDLSKAIKSDPATKGMAVVLLAGAFEPIDEAKKTQCKADGKLVKPFQTEELLNALKPFVKESAAPAAAQAAEEFVIAEEEETVEAEESFGGIGDDSDPWAAQAAAPVMAAPAEEEAVEAEAYEAEAVAEEAVEADAYDAAPAEEEAMEADAYEAEAVAEEAVEADAYEAEAYEAEGEEPMAAVDALEEPMAEEVAEVYAEAEAVEAEAYEAPAARRAAPVAAAAPAMPALSKEEAAGILRDVAMQLLRESITKGEIKSVIADTVRPFVQEHLEKIMYDIAPEVLDRTIKASITDSLKAVNKELENIIWETVPDMAEMLIKKELEKIKADI